MTPSGLKEALETLGWKQKELSERINMTQTQVSRWSRGAPVPGAVVAYLKLAVRVKELGDRHE